MPIDPEAAVAVGFEQHVGGADVGAVGLFEQIEGEDLSLSEESRSAGAGGGVVALPDRTEAEDRDLPGVPVVQAVEAQELVERGDPGGVPPLVRFPLPQRTTASESGEQVLLRCKGEEVTEPRAGPVVLDQPLQTRHRHAWLNTTGTPKQRLGADDPGGGVTGPERRCRRR